MVTVRRALALVVVAFLAVGITGFILTAVFFARIPLGEPKLRVELYPPPPWQVRPGGSFEVSIGVANDGWLLAWAKDIRMVVTMPAGFSSARTGTNQCELNFFTLHGGDGLGNGINVTVSSNVSPGNYTVTMTVLGENVPEKTLTPQVTVLAL